MKQLLCFSLVLVLLASCKPVSILQERATITPDRITPASKIFATESTRLLVDPTPTEFPLPYDPTIMGESEYCNLAQVNMPKPETEALSIEEVTQKLLELWLDHYLSPDAPPFCIIQQYQIDRIY